MKSKRLTTKRQVEEEELQQNEPLFTNFFNLSPELIAITREKDGIIMIANPMFSEVLGYSPEEYSGKTSDELGIWVDLNQQKDLMKDLFSKGFVKKEVTLRAKNGSLLVMLLSAKPMEYQGQDCLILMAADITEQKVIEENIKKNEKKLRWAQAIGHIGYSEYIIGEQVIWISTESMSIFGYPPIEGFFPIEKINECIPNFISIQKEAIELGRQGKKTNVEFVLNPADGSPLRYIHAISDVEWDKTGNPIRILSTFRDITEQKKTESSLLESESRLRSFIDSTSEGMLIIDENGIIEEWNKAIEVITGVPKEDVLNRSWWNLALSIYPPELCNSTTKLRLEREINMILQTGQIISSHKIHQVLHRSGVLKHVEQNLFTIKSETGYRIAVIIKDITERKKAEDELNQTRKLNDSLIESVPGLVFFYNVL